MLPVKSRWSKGRRLNASPTSGPPVQTAISVSSKACAKRRARSSDVAGVYSEGFTMQRLPAARMEANGAKTMLTGKFHGAISPTTPSGCG